MRIVHTSDWHVGRIWKGHHRRDEIEAVLEHLATFIESETIDLVLVTGDLFDTGAPVAWAEQIVFRFFKRVGLAGVHSVVIAGNHDNPARLDAWGQLAELVLVHAVGLPKPPNDGGVCEISVACGETAVVAAVPFAAPRRLVSALQLAADDTTSAQTYADKMGRLIELLCRHFRADAVNLLCAHTHLDGALFTGSERRVHLGDDWAVTPQSLPHDAHYVALGHIHKPQRVDHAPAPTLYAGSPLQMDFGEVDEDKSFVVIEAHPGQPAHIERVPYQGGRTLHRVTASLAEIEQRVDELAALGWLRVEVPTETIDMDINRKVRTLLPNAVTVDIVLPTGEDDDDSGDQAPLSLTEHAASEAFCDHYRRRHGVDPEPALIELFRALEAECGG